MANSHEAVLARRTSKRTDTPPIVDVIEALKTETALVQQQVKDVKRLFPGIQRAGENVTEHFVLACIRAALVLSLLPRLASRL